MVQSDKLIVSIDEVAIFLEAAEERAAEASAACFICEPTVRVSESSFREERFSSG